MNWKRWGREANLMLPSSSQQLLVRSRGKKPGSANRSSSFGKTSPTHSPLEQVNNYNRTNRGRIRPPLGIDLNHLSITFWRHLVLSGSSCELTKFGLTINYDPGNLQVNLCCGPRLIVKVLKKSFIKLALKNLPRTFCELHHQKVGVFLWIFFQPDRF